jgi:hypothetical protein
MKWISERQQHDPYADDVLRGVVAAEAWHYENHRTRVTSTEEIRRRLQRARRRMTEQEAADRRERKHVTLLVCAFAAVLLIGVSGLVAAAFGVYFAPPPVSSETPTGEPALEWPVMGWRQWLPVLAMLAAGGLGVAWLGSQLFILLAAIFRLGRGTVHVTRRVVSVKWSKAEGRCKPK